MNIIKSKQTCATFTAYQFDHKVAGIVMSMIALFMGEILVVPWHVIPGIFASGAVSLGFSLALFYSAMRYIGAGQTGLISSTSTLWGIVAAIIILDEVLSLRVIGGGLLMILGVLIFALESGKTEPSKASIS